MTGRWHFTVVLGGQPVTADYREPITEAMGRVAADRPRPDDRERILTWWREHAIQSQNCRDGQCDHVV